MLDCDLSHSVRGTFRHENSFWQCAHHLTAAGQVEE